MCRDSYESLPLLCSLALLPALEAQQFPYGRWYPAYHWGVPVPQQPVGVLNLIHAGLISTGPQKGKVVFLTWDDPNPAPPHAGVHWGILDPDLQVANTAPPMATFTHVAPAPAGITNWQEATCVGQSWTPDGRWFVAGGQISPPGGVGHGFGSNGAWIYDPDVVGFGGPAVGAWFRQQDMLKQRYYPTVLLTQTDSVLAPLGELIAAGGSHDFWLPWQPNNQYHDDYETFRPGARGYPTPLSGTWQTLPGGSRLFPGPTGTAQFRWYPRLFLLPDGRMANIATEPQSTIALHPVSSAANWTNLGARTIAGSRGYGTALLCPNFGPAFENTVVNIGGQWGASNPTTNVEWANAGSLSATNWPGHLWTASPAQTALPPLNLARLECNSVILPTGDVLVLGDGSLQQYRTPELLSGGVWKNMPDEASVRDHHAIGLLLPSGRVLSASGNHRWYDFQVYEPAYLSAGPRPAWGAVPGNGVLLRGQTVTVPITMPPGTVVGKVVLMRPGSLTHHADMDQRYVQLPFVASEDMSTVDIQAPDGPPLFNATTPRLSAPLGHYMIFLLTTTGVPSVAHFVRFQ